MSGKDRSKGGSNGGRKIPTPDPAKKAATRKKLVEEGNKQKPAPKKDDGKK